MSKRELRFLYKRATGRSPHGESSMRGEKIRTFPNELEDYIDWLEDELIKHKKLKGSLIPWESLDK